MDVKKLDNFSLKGYQEVKVTKMGNITEIQYMARANTEQIIQRIDKDTYLNLLTGEICDVKHMETRADDKRSIQRTMKLGRNIINANIADSKNTKFITGTYKENMTDSKRLYKDFKYFVTKLSKIYDFEYVVAREPQERGAWHFHMIMIFPNTAPFIPNEQIQKLWSHGYTYTTKLDDVDNVGAYLTAYLTDIPVVNDKQIKPGDIVKINDQGKKFLKGARLKFYPPGMHIFTWSKGIKKPEVEYMDYKRAKKEVSSAKLTYSSSSQIKENNFTNIIHKEFYNKIRK